MQTNCAAAQLLDSTRSPAVISRLVDASTPLTVEQRRGCWWQWSGADQKAKLHSRDGAYYKSLCGKSIV
jgi:hypothetical protein